MALQKQTLVMVDLGSRQHLIDELAQWSQIGEVLEPTSLGPQEPYLTVAGHSLVRAMSMKDHDPGTRVFSGLETRTLLTFDRWGMLWHRSAKTSRRPSKIESRGP